MKRIAILLEGIALSGFLILAPLMARGQDAATGTGVVVANEVPSGTRFLVGLQEALGTKDAKAGDHFTVRTLEPLATANGLVLPPGTQLRGHVDKVETGHKTGRARIWLTFDDVRTPFGRMPIVADVTDVPGVHSVKADYDREGEIEARTSNREEEVKAAAAGAFAGAAAGVVAHNNKEAAAGAAAGAATAFMVASGLGQELTLEKGTKLELVLDRPLYIARN